jgi:endonuclease/exonuclease/phosphatase family metal-dependent hydrolase
MKRRTVLRGLTVMDLVVLAGAIILMLMCPPYEIPARAAAPSPGEGPMIRVMTFNILNGRSDWHVGRWENRKAAVVDRIHAFDPDLLGLQEALSFQSDYIQGELPGYGHVGVGRGDGKDRGEQAAIFYRLSRFEKLQEGHFWLSDEPDEAGSKYPWTVVQRMVTWVELRTLDEQPRTIWYFNTHFDPLSEGARLKSAALLRERIAAMTGDGATVIVTGDFNAPADDKTYRAVMDGDNSPHLVDAWRELQTQPASNEGTYHLIGGLRVNRRLDWILHTPDLAATEVEIDMAKVGGKYPSDHFPVEAVLRFADGK